MQSSVILNHDYDWNTVVLQPTSLCNLNCNYCYLPDRREKHYLKENVVKQVAQTISSRNKKTMILWHGGEPLAVGIKKFKDYLSIFSNNCSTLLCEHSLQTNATLITDEWCEFFNEHRIRIGVSLDGNASHTRARKTWAGYEAFDQAVSGIKLLQKHGISFGIIAVINEFNIEQPETVYEFLSSLKPWSISINFEELEGLNTRKSLVFNKQRVDEFWNRLFLAWKGQPSTSIRHFRDSLVRMNEIIDGTYRPQTVQKNIYPTVDTEGNVTLLSPEFISVPKAERNRFIVGNVLDNDLDFIVSQGKSAWFVQDYIEGVHMCAEYCEYFVFCQGGQASNKYFEHGTIKVTETQYCYASRIAPAKIVLESVQSSV